MPGVVNIGGIGTSKAHSAKSNTKNPRAPWQPVPPDRTAELRRIAAEITSRWSGMPAFQSSRTSKDQQT